MLGAYAARTRVVHLPARLSELIARSGGSLLGRWGPTMVSSDSVRGWNLDLEVGSRTLWDRLGLEAGFPNVLSGIPAVLDGMVAFRWRHPVSDRS